ncbi:MAG: type II and III secretion system protein family protein [Acidobacteriaceae bacterium]|nr:type II and III secretion system protein family protein [Acidobacteriaceae bacterium]
MNRRSTFRDSSFFAFAAFCWLAGRVAFAADTLQTTNGPLAVTVTVSKSVVIEHGTSLKRISVSNPDIAEAVAVSSTEVLINGKSPGDTTLMMWDSAGKRSEYDVHVQANTAKVDAVREELRKEAGADVSLELEGGTVFLRGTVPDPITADRAQSIASALGKVVNLLRVLVPASDPQILLKVRFANVSRTASAQYGFNLFTADQKGVSNVTTGQFGQNPTFNQGSQGSAVTFSDLLNIFYLRPDLNMGAFIQALEAKSLLEILAEPNLLTLSGKPASFLAGGEFPFPTLQGGASGIGQITIQFKEFGIRLNFLPLVTPRGTIRLVVTPEVSSLDYSNGLTVGGYTVPGLATRRVQTEVELEDGQSFVIAGLLDNQTTEQLDKIPGLANLPVLGKLFQSKSLIKNNSELMVMVTPQLVRPIPAGVKPPELNMPETFLKGSSPAAPQQPGAAVTGPAESLPRVQSLPIEELKIMTEPAAPANMPQGGVTVQPLPIQQNPSATVQGNAQRPGNQ